jgi:hypothetical protein
MLSFISFRDRSPFCFFYFLLISYMFLLFLLLMVCQCQVQNVFLALAIPWAIQCTINRLCHLVHAELSKVESKQGAKVPDMIRHDMFINVVRCCESW